ncbi:hypothetical protein EG68_09069 [Paragonimus skrjabini miyazakii]|uniref:GPI ethanolamine phosphate transferase 1 n=1 Tax=Paragonimus skrjabini miyazakii TaxID=59628 RepID=A0A8S9YB17_9TREM|nr:hypothetical protein EG68_09069 [Paragonimus skrjabini miyazakii]
MDMKTFRRGHIAFLHMDAADLVGHAFKPNSDEYIEMVRNVDSLVSEVVHEVTRLSSGLDVKVAFILSADHGMTEWGSHGAGSLHETVTPLLAWGAGLIRPELLPSSDALTGFDQYGLPLHNHGRRRRELQQADLCPLMANLLGIPIPVNSVGRVPLDFLDVNSSVKAQLVRANCMQLLSQLQLKLLEKRGSHFRAFFKEFDKLTESNIEERLRSAELLTSNDLHDQAIESYEQLANLTLMALTYYHKYDRPFFSFCIGASFLLWSLVIWCKLASPGDTKYVSNQYRHRFDQCFQLTTFVLLTLILLVLGFSYLSPYSHTVFQLLPLVLSLYLVRSSSHKARLYNMLVFLFKKSRETDYMTGYYTTQSSRVGNSPFTVASLITVASFLLLELLIWGFHYRPLLFVACIILAIWPALDRSFGSDRAYLHRFWFLACCTLAVFPLLPVIGSSFSPKLVVASGMAITPVSLLIFRNLSRSPVEYTKHNFLLSPPRMLRMGYLFSFLFASSSCAVGLVHSHLGFLPSIRFAIHIFSWTMLLLPSLFVLKWLSPRLGLRLFGWISVFLIPLILLSTGYEVLFFIAFMTVGLLWIHLEAPGRDWTQVWFRDTSASCDVCEVQSTCLSGDTNDLVTLKNFRHVNSFDPRSTYCFLTILKPGVMGLFLLIKVLCPMMCLAIIYAAVQLVSTHRGSVNVQTGLCTIMSNFIAVHFFTCLRDEGSWLEIGNSISHYVIAMVIGLVAFLFAFFGRQLLSVSLQCSDAATRKYV